MRYRSGNMPSRWATPNRVTPPTRGFGGKAGTQRRAPHYVEYNATVSPEGACPAEPFWFLEIFRHRVFRRVEMRADSELPDKRQEFDRKWGYQSCVPWSDGG